MSTLTTVKREGTARPSFAKFILEHQKQYQLEDKELAYIAGGMFGAGSDTVSSYIASCLNLTDTVIDCVCNYNYDYGCYHSHGRTGSCSRGT
jgi:hypothetical protein